MAIVFGNRAWMSTATTGTGTLTLGSAISGYQSFANAGVASADVVPYAIIDGANWELGLGTYTAAGTTMNRASISESSSGGSAINLSGSATVLISPRKEDLLNMTALVAANRVLIGPTSSSAAPTFRQLVAADMPAASDTAVGAVELAIQSEMETGTDTTRVVVPGRQHFHPSAAKVWTVFTNAGVSSGDFNLTSVTDSGTGDWTVNIATDFSGTGYAYTGGVRSAADRWWQGNAIAAGTFQVNVYQPGGAGAGPSLADGTGMTFAAFGDL